MTLLDCSFEIPDWEAVLSSLKPGQEFSAAAFLTMMESRSDEEVEDAFSLLQDKGVLLDLSSLPASFGNGETALRLRREYQLVKEETLLEKLEENDPLRLCLEEIVSGDTSASAESLAEKLLAGDKNVVAELTCAMLPHVVTAAYENVGRGALLLDLIQEGSLGLWQGMLAYSGGDFSEHCMRAVRMSMAVAVIGQLRADGFGQRLRKSMEDYQAVDEKLLSDLGRNPTVEEIAEYLHITLDEAIMIRDMLDAARMMAQAVPDTRQDDEQEDLAVEDTAYFQMRQRIQELLSDLDDDETKLLSLRFGLDGKPPMSPEEAGKYIGLTPEEVLAREAQALAKLRMNKDN